MAETSPCLRAAVEAALEAGRMLRAGIDSRPEVAYKGEVDLVTEFDRRSQEMIHRRLSEAFPDHGFLAEEDLSAAGRSAFRWIIDPLDGTTNYAHTLPIFSISIALEREGETVLGVVHDPMRSELFRAERGGGAFLNDRPIRVSATADLGRGLLATGFPYDVRESELNNCDHWTNFIFRAQAVRRCGSAALDLAYVACGRFDGFWELKLKPWDVAAGDLLVREAGGRVTDFAGRPVRIRHPEVLASNGRLHEAMQEVLRLGRTAGDG